MSNTWLVCALNDQKLVKKLLALPIKEMTVKMLEVCRTHLAINGEMEAWDSAAPSLSIPFAKHSRRGGNSRRQLNHNSSSSNSTPVETAHSSMPQDEPPAQQRMPNALHVVRQDTIGANADR